jgi:hypothetical protein
MEPFHLVDAVSRNARQAGYTSGIARIISTPSDVSMFSRLPEADQQAILRQANNEEFERYIGHAYMKLRGRMREERAGKRTEAPAPPPPPSSAPATVSASPATGNTASITAAGVSAVTSTSVAAGTAADVQ